MPPFQFVNAGGAPDWQSDVEKTLGEIRGNPVGRIVLERIEKSPHKLIFMPYGGHCNASADAQVQEDSYPSGLRSQTANPLVRDRGLAYGGAPEDRTKPSDPRFEPPQLKGPTTGRGSDALVTFSRGAYPKDGCANRYLASSPAEALVHELVHAQRVMQGVRNPVPTRWVLHNWRELHYRNEEEFLAIVVTNVFVSVATGNQRLRADYPALTVLEKPLNTSLGFVREEVHQEILDYHSKKWQPIFGQLGRIKTDFNPFAIWQITNVGAVMPVLRAAQRLMHGR
jgi:hypothetical protein